MKNTILQEKIDNAPEEIQELFTLLLTDDDTFDEVFLESVENVEILNANKIDFLSGVFSLAFKIDSERDLENFLIKIKYGEKEAAIIKRNMIRNFLETFNELERTTNINKNSKQDSAPSVETNTISHQDLLSEIENPTPSISTTTSFQSSIDKSAAAASVKAASVPATEIKAPNNATAKSAGPAEPSLHSSAAIPTYDNPALKIASKLDQNMATPSASIPKDIYVSKKPDPYHEPVDL